MSKSPAVALNKGCLPALSSGSIHSYISAVYSIPNLEREEEITLAKNWAERGCLESVRKLVLAHLKSVVYIAKEFKNYGMPQEELIQEGNIGLMKAVKRFSPENGARLFTFAQHWVYAEIADYVVRNYRQIKIATTKAQRKLFFNLRKFKKSTTWMKDSEVRELSEKLDVPFGEVRRMEGRLTSKDLSFGGTTTDDDSDQKTYEVPEEYLGTDELSGEAYMLALEDSEYKDRIHGAVNSLDDRSKDIINARWFNDDKKVTLHDLAAKYSVSGERIRQLEVNALKKIKLKLSESEEN